MNKNDRKPTPRLHGTCRFYEPVDAGKGICTAGPPTGCVIPVIDQQGRIVQYQGISVWPPVESVGNACGAFQQAHPDQIAMVRKIDNKEPAPSDGVSLTTQMVDKSDAVLSI